MIPNLDRTWLWGLVGDEAIAELWAPQRLTERMVRFEAAYVRALGRCGAFETERAERLARVIETASPDPARLREGTRRDGVPVVALVAELRAAAGQDAERIHTGATSQDVVDTALVLTLRDTTSLVLERLHALSARLDTLIEGAGASLMTGRTRMQAAEPIRVADRLVSWRAPLVDLATQLAEDRPRVERLQFGGAVGNRAASGEYGDAIAQHLADLLGLINPPGAWHTAREPIVAYGDRLARIAGALGKMGQDICLMSQQGVDEIAIAGGGGSSAMPHKRNPVEAELLVTLARFAATQTAGLHLAMVHEQERSGTAWVLEWLTLPQIAAATARALGTAQALLHRVERVGPALPPA